MKVSVSKKSMDLLSFFLCCSLLLLPPALGSPSSQERTVTQKPTAINLSPDLPGMFVQVNESHLRSSVQSIQGFGPHPTGSPALDAVGDFLFSEFTALNISVKYDPWHEKQNSGKNIVATIPGVRSAAATVLICAHYDSLAISPGAEDDGSGVAAVLMIADIMHHYSFNTTVKFILFSGEEQGLLGSRSYAKNASDANENIIGVLALDKIGYAITSEEGNSLKHHANPASAWMANISRSVACRYPNEIELTVLCLPQDPESDHLSFVEQGYAGSDFVRNATNPFYHTSEDIADHMNFSYLTKVCKLALGTIATIACFSPKLNNRDLKIMLQGSLLSNPAQFSVFVENNNNAADTANVTITVTMKHLLRRGYVQTIKQGITTPCNWSVVKEINHSWKFDVAGRSFSRGFFKLEVILSGRADDLYLYVTQQTYGVILSPFRVLMIPRI
jgi:aminopeptidase YwaD